MINKSKYLVVMVFLLALAACTSDADFALQPSNANTTDPASINGETIFFPRQVKTNGERAVMEGETTGTLILAENCIRLRNDKSTTNYLLIWPSDFSYSIENDTVKILDGKREIVASLGEKVYMGGGEIPLLSMIEKSVQEQISPRCTGPYWIIGEGFIRVDTLK